MHRLPPLLANMAQITRHSRAGAALLIASLAVVLFTGPPASAQSGNGGLNEVTVSFREDLARIHRSKLERAAGLAESSAGVAALAVFRSL